MNTALYDVLIELGANESRARAAADAVPDKQHLATREDIAEVKVEMAELRSEVRTEIAGVKTEMAELRSELRTEMAELRSEVRTEIAGVKTEMAELRTEIAELRLKSGPRLPSYAPKCIGAFGWWGSVLSGRFSPQSPSASSS